MTQTYALWGFATYYQPGQNKNVEYICRPDSSNDIIPVDDVIENDIQVPEQSNVVINLHKQNASHGTDKKAADWSRVEEKSEETLRIEHEKRIEGEKQKLHDILDKRVQIYNQNKLLMKRLSELGKSLSRWKMNITRMWMLRRQLDSQLNQTYFILTRQNTPLGERFFNSNHQKPVQMTVVKRALLPLTSPFSDVTRYKSCGVVGNGAILRNSHCGVEIDSLDFIMRSDLQPIDQYKDDAGRKTNLVSISPNTNAVKILNIYGNFDVPFLVKAASEYSGYVLWIPNSRNVSNNMAFKIAQHINKQTSQRLQTLLLNVAYPENFRRFWRLRGTVLSSSMTLISIGFTICETIHVFGVWPFEFDEKMSAIPSLYSSDLPAHHGKGENLTSEFELLTQLHDQGILRLHVGKCI
ncbi:alpha-N-acetylneuraminide alpha-2,8-sialyltransferase-like [Saccoglossus kowalevskii]|uniref:Alpha-2,8-sialyltransferase 8F-like n=1 Tax=Saccoglossus kowalevskii TaxID=10224 RepID=A0ABM0MWS7_SACKO|nr:PREDICTED: alpha-2,8-sialyltransferase 8F-like [Saccoglossus kowalevskii]